MVMCLGCKQHPAKLQVIEIIRHCLLWSEEQPLSRSQRLGKAAAAVVHQAVTGPMQQLSLHGVLTAAAPPKRSRRPPIWGSCGRCRRCHSATTAANQSATLPTAAAVMTRAKLSWVQPKTHVMLLLLLRLRGAGKGLQGAPLKTLAMSADR